MKFVEQRYDGGGALHAVHPSMVRHLRLSRVTGVCYAFSSEPWRLDITLHGSASVAYVSTEGECKEFYVALMKAMAEYGNDDA